jgi:hypothetical protein
MENTQTQKLAVLIAVTTVLCIIEILFFCSDTFMIVKSISALIGAVGIIYYLYAVARVLTED